MSDKLDRLVLAYRGPDGDSCIVDQALEEADDFSAVPAIR